MLLKYPDGNDYANIELQNLIWTLCYQKHPELNKIEVDAKLFRFFKKILEYQYKNTPVFITNSHVRAYTFVHDIIGMIPHAKANIINVDMHHDMYPHNRSEKEGCVDCGNWLRILRKQKIVTDITWITREAGKQINIDDDRRFLRPNTITTDATILLDKHFDGIFICRSNMWLPPHLDHKFHELIRFCKNHFNDVTITEDVEKPRKLHEAPKIEMPSAAVQIAADVNTKNLDIDNTISR